MKGNKGYEGTIIIQHILSATRPSNRVKSIVKQKISLKHSKIARELGSRDKFSIKTKSRALLSTLS